MSKTIEEIKEERAQECLARNWSQLLVVGLTNTDIDYIAERYAQSQTQGIQEQNAELVVLLKKCKELMENSIFTPHKNTASVITHLLTKYNHLKSNTNGN